MPVSKRLRYEILRRDNFACTYCGATAPSVQLTVDHVVPVALGGGDKPTNLTTACTDCNSGKSATPPTAPVVDAVTDEARRWADAITTAAALMRTDRARRDAAYDAFAAKWDRWTITSTGETVPRPDDWRDTVDLFVAAQVPDDEVFDAINIAMRANARDTWKYFCGVVWRKVEALRQIATQVAAADHKDGWQ